MFIHNINPVLLSLGPVEIRYYGIIYALGFLFAYLALKKAVKKGELPLNQQDLDKLLLSLIIAVVIGARLAEIIFYNPSYYLTHSLEIFALWHGGLSFHGGLIGAAVVCYYFAKKRKMSALSLMDTLTIPAAFALALGRIANFINAEVYGTPTNLPWAVKFPQDELYRHPSQIYEAFKNLLISFILLAIKRQQLPPGFLSGLFLLLYGTLRFLIEFIKEPEAMLGPLTMGQALSLPMIIIGIMLLRRKH